jgi:hypothetical protein
MLYRWERRGNCWYADGLSTLELDGKRCELRTQKKDRAFSALTWWVQNNCWVFIYTSGLSVSNQREVFRWKAAIRAMQMSNWREQLNEKKKKQPDQPAQKKRRSFSHNTAMIDFCFGLFCCFLCNTKRVIGDKQLDLNASPFNFFWLIETAKTNPHEWRRLQVK